MLVCTYLMVGKGLAEAGENSEDGCGAIICPGDGDDPVTCEKDDPECILRLKYAAAAAAADSRASKPGGPSETVQDGKPAELPSCWEEALEQQPESSSPYWRGHSAAEGRVVRQVCREGSGVSPQVLVPYFQPFSEPATTPPPPDPAVLAEQAVNRLVIPMPQPHFGPDRSTIAVQLWTWLWIDAPAPVTSTVELQGVSVTATATLQSTTWTLGEPAARNDGGGYEPGPAATVTCTGAGVPYDASVDWRAEPPCGHKFRWRSTDERTGGSGKWPVTVTTTWGVTWQATTGQTGTATLTGTAADAVAVSEYRILLTPGR